MAYLFQQLVRAVINKKNFLNISLIFFIIGLVFYFTKVEFVQAGSEHNVWGWTWSEDIGWVSFNSKNCDFNGDGITDNLGNPIDGNYDNCSEGQPVANYGVHINPITGYFSGYAWLEYIGWLRFDPVGPYPSFPNTTQDSAKVDLATGEVSGWARMCFVYESGCEGDLNNNRGGADGWISLDTLYSQVIIDILSPSPHEFLGWAWGGEDFYSGPILDWLSFNSRNCDSDDNGYSDGLGYCPPSGTLIAKYRVYTSLIESPPVNQPPYVESVLLDGLPEYCGIGKGRGQISLKWTYHDVDEDWQEQYHLQASIYSDFSVLAIDYGGPDNLSEAIQTVSPGDKGTSAFIVVTGSPDPAQLQIGYRKSYYWRVRVRAATGNQTWSNWVDFNDPSDIDGDGNSKTVTTPDKAYPYSDFTYSPLFPKSGEPVIFTDSSSCFTITDQEYYCFDGGGNVYFEWDFKYVPPTADFDLIYDATEYPEDFSEIVHIYDTPTDYTVWLQVRDDYPVIPSKRICSKKVPFGIKLPVPGWKEVQPF